MNLGTGKGISVLEMLKKTEEVIGRPIPFSFEPRRPGDPAIVVAASDKAKELLNWQATNSDLDNIIRTTWAVYKNQ